MKTKTPPSHPVYQWAWYEGKEYFCIPNLAETRKRGHTMIDLCHCVTSAMNDIVIKTIPYDPEKVIVR